jgi:hypothetical protein
MSRMICAGIALIDTHAGGQKTTTGRGLVTSTAIDVITTGARIEVAVAATERIERSILHSGLAT